jgi:hypothetical protein
MEHKDANGRGKLWNGECHGNIRISSCVEGVMNYWLLSLVHEMQADCSSGPTAKFPGSSTLVAGNHVSSEEKKSIPRSAAPCLRMVESISGYVGPTVVRCSGGHHAERNRGGRRRWISI